MILVATAVFLYYTIWTLFMVTTPPLASSPVTASALQLLLLCREDC